MRNRDRLEKILLTIAWLSLMTGVQANPIAPKSSPSRLKVVVNHPLDTIQADEGITLREAIALINGELTLDRLSPQERAQVEDLGNSNTSTIEFNLPAGSTKISLTRELPPIQMAGVTIDGTTQPGYVPKSRTDDRVILPQPLVEIAPAPAIEIGRGLSILADNVTVRGLSIYGFSRSYQTTQDVPSGDIFIAHRLPAPDTSQQQKPTTNAPFHERYFPPKNVIIEGNYLGMKSDRTMPSMTSDFGVYVFNSQGTTIKHNAINYHSASGIITAVKADRLLVEENVILGNGMSGMPDAIRLEGEIRNNQIKTNLICANDGSAVFLFKPAIGAVNISNNTIKFNGRRLRRAAIHLMGNDHQVIDNHISHQAGSGVTVTAFPQPHAPTGDVASARNLVTTNRFARLEGLSIDLNTYRHDSVEDFQDGDGINPDRNTDNRRLDTGNMAINAPRFLSREFLLLNDRVNVDGVADPGSTIEFYQVKEDQNPHGPLNLSLGTVTADRQGKFGITLMGLKPGEAISAIASDPKYGTSEPARNAIVTIPGATTTPTIAPQSSDISTPECLSGPLAVPLLANADPKPPVVVTPPAPPKPLPQKIRLEIPANVHFALDKSNISARSGEVIKQIAKVLQQHPYIVIDLEGHTDPRASNDYNQRLGLRRAKSTRDYLVRQGIAPERITIRSYGETKLKTPRIDILDHARNRRVEFFYRDIRGIELEIIEQENDLQLEQKRRS